MRRENPPESQASTLSWAHPKANRMPTPERNEAAETGACFLGFLGGKAVCQKIIGDSHALVRTKSHWSLGSLQWAAQVGRSTAVDRSGSGRAARRNCISQNARPTSRQDPCGAPAFPALGTVVWRLLTAQPSCGCPPGLSERPIPKSKGKIIMANNTSIVGSPSETQTGANHAASLQSPKSKRGFAALDPVVVRELARKGGIAAHRVGTAHEFSSEEARAAGRKGGLASHSGLIRPIAQSEGT